jgi:hypothetical protein
MIARDKILRLINEQNDLWREVTLDNVVMDLPRPIDPTSLLSIEEAGTHEWIADQSMDISIWLDGAGGGGGGSVDWESPERWNGAGNGQDGAREPLTLTMKPGDRLRFVLGTGGQPGLASDRSIGESGEPGGESELYLNNELVATVEGGVGGKGGDVRYSWAGSYGGRDGGPGGGGRKSSISSDGTWGRGQDGLPGSDGRVYIGEYVDGIDYRNTAIKLHGVLNNGYKGSTDIYYRRHSLTELFAGQNPEIRERDFTAQSILDTLNSRYGLFLELADIVSLEAPTFTEGDLETTAPLELAVKDDSLGWTGTVTVGILYGNPILESVVLIQLLPILTHPEDLEELGTRKSGLLSTYNFDFTKWKDDLQVDPNTQQWLNFARVQEIGKIAGLSYWYNNRVLDLPTSSVPTANQNFERVLVQNYAGGDVLGPLYFHYDANW